MKKINLKLITFFAAVITVTALGSAAIAQNRPYQVSTRTVQTVLDRIDNNLNSLKSDIGNISVNDSQNGGIRADRAGTLIANFENSTDNLKNKFSSRGSTSADVQAVLEQAYPLNTFIRNSSVTTNARNRWQTLRNDLDTLAGYYNVRASWNDTVSNPDNQGGYTVSDTQLQSLLARLRTREQSFRMSFESWARYGGRNRTTTNAELTQSIDEFEAALADLNTNYSSRNGRGVEPVLRPSVTINNSLAANRTNMNVTSKWTLVRNDLTTLAGYYRLSWDWNNPVYRGGGRDGDRIGDGNDDRNGDPNGGIDARLTGTYRLNTSQSDNASTIVEQAIANANYPQDQVDRSRRMLERRLQSPETLAFEKRGQQITMSSSNAAAVTLQADGVSQSETSPNGRTFNTTVTATDREITINYEGDRMNDFYVTFAPAKNGQLRVTRRVNLEGQNQSVTVTSVYDKTSRTPQWNTTIGPSGTGSGSQDRFFIPNNTSITASLDRALSTRSSRDGDRFSMTVTSPSQYQGAVIEGVVTGQPSGVVSGRATMAITFQTIRLRNGQTYRFAGIVDQVRDSNGNAINVNNEGVIRDGSQTTRTVERTGIGALIGGIIGAIAGGGEGAAIGAGAGAGVGAGSVVLQGRDNLDLRAGTMFNITATAPAYAGQQ